MIRKLIEWYNKQTERFFCSYCDDELDEKPHKNNPLSKLCDKCLIRLSWKNINKEERKRFEKMIKRGDFKK